ncbi:hypothetical protein ACKWTF_011117 [Chironomus riparius]
MNTKLFTVIIAALCISSIACEKIPTDSDVISMIDKLDEENSLPLFGGLTLEKVESANDNSPRSSESLTDRIISYLKSHTVNYELSEARTGEARGKLKKLMLPILLALKFKSAVILPVVFTLLTLISLKALKVGLIALLMAGKLKSTY